jgi:hypothetical protein
LGIDPGWDSVKKALGRMQRAGVSNLWIVQADARVAFDRLIRPVSVHAVYALFPVPWPKKKQAKHRLFSHTFLRVLNNRLIPEGETRIVTDHEPYLHWILEQIPESGFEAAIDLVPPRLGTNYENKWRRRGQARFHELRLFKRRHLEVPFQEDVALMTLRVNHFDPERFEPADYRNDCIVVFKEFLFDPRRRKGMVRVVVVDNDLKQNFWIEIISSRGLWYIRPSQGCSIVPTAGVRSALDLVRKAAS